LPGGGSLPRPDPKHRPVPGQQLGKQNQKQEEETSMPGTIARRRKTFGLVTVLRQTTALSVVAFAAATSLGGAAEAKVSRIVADKVEALKDAAGQTIGSVATTEAGQTKAG
jgi:hypothetical protein